MEKRYYELVAEHMATKRKNHLLIPRDEYMCIVDNIKDIKRSTEKNPTDRITLMFYDVVKYGTCEKLISPTKYENGRIVFYVTLEETFKIIHDCHISIGHAGKSKMMPILRDKYKNVTAGLVSIYLELCEYCKNKSLAKKLRILTPKNN